MPAAIIPVETFDYVIFGATGDLTMRKLLPALYHRFRDGQIPGESRIIGAARSGHTTEKFRDIAREALGRFVKAPALDETTVEAFVSMVHYASVNGATGENWQNLQDHFSDEAMSGRVRVFYLATAPNLYGDTCRNLSDNGLVTGRSRVVLEKPIGIGLASAREINERVGQYFAEEQVFRIDHYLGKETVQNLMALRFANTVFERLWTADCIDHVQITVAETVGVEGRAAYYDTSGALRDMVQNHLLQCLCMLAMEPPTTLEADAVRDEKLKVLRALKPLSAHDIAVSTVRGQYVRGSSDGKTVPGYLEELEGSDSRTETFVAIKAEIRSWRWGKVPFYLRTGKRLPTRVSEIVVQFRNVPYSPFPREIVDLPANQLIIRLQPDEGIQMVVVTKDPGPGGLRLRPAKLDISFEKAFSTRFPDAYERLLMDTVRGNSVLFMRRDEVEAAWMWVEPILEAWRDSPEHPKPYAAGSWGPTASIALIERDGRTWHEELLD